MEGARECDADDSMSRVGGILHPRGLDDKGHIFDLVVEDIRHKSLVKAVLYCRTRPRFFRVAVRREGQTSPPL